MSDSVREVSTGRRFEFGKNWQSFLSTLDEERILEAEKSLRTMLECDDLSGKTFLDIGSGSGLSSLAARRLGARVHSFDYDPQSVACTAELKHRFFPDDQDWQVEEGSALDEGYLRSLGSFDIVNSWGVLHHTGDMWRAMKNAVIPVSETGLLFIAIYNDQQEQSKMWAAVKRAYCRSRVGRAMVLAIFVPYFFLQTVAIGLVRYRNPFKAFSEYKKKRGMSAVHDWVDWLGGYPYEVAKPEEVIDFHRDMGFQLRKLVSTNRLGCNQFVFEASRATERAEKWHRDDASGERPSVRASG